MTTQRIAPVVTDLHHQVQQPRRSGHPVELSEILGLLETMSALVDSESLRADVDRIQTADEAISRGVADIQQPSRHMQGLLDATPEEIQERVRQAAFDRTAREATAYTVYEHFRRRLARDAGPLMLSHCDEVVARTRGDFDTHAQVVTDAAARGLSSATDPAELLQNADAETLEAYRALPRAVAALDQIAALRTQMAELLGYGPTSPIVAAFVTGVNRDDLQTAVNRYAGDTEVAQYNAPVVGSALVNVHKQRTGGAWLALANAGVTLHLNTADETTQVLTAATKRD